MIPTREGKEPAVDPEICPRGPDDSRNLRLRVVSNFLTSFNRGRRRACAPRIRHYEHLRNVSFIRSIHLVCSYMLSEPTDGDYGVYVNGSWTGMINMLLNNVS